MDQLAEIRTLRTTADECSDGRTCPAIHQLTSEPDTLYVVGKQVDPATRARFAHLLASDETLTAVPQRLLPEV